MKLLRSILSVTLITLSLQSALASVPPKEAQRLGNELTPVGAEKAGNEAGTIPAWTGGLTQPPAGYKPGQHMVNPYPEDKIVEVITAQNLAQYRDKLSPGQIAMLERYPETYKINVYPTRRSAALPESVYQAIQLNAVTAELVENGNGVVGYKEAVPFPIPKTGLEVVWNHLMRYRGGSLARQVVQSVVQTNGDYQLVHLNEKSVFAEHMQGHDPNDDNILVYFMQEITAPARLTGNVLLVHDTVNQVKQPRRAWVYNAGQRRVRSAPQVAYDGPGTAADGLRTADNFDLYGGAPDRYTWKLVGKQEIYIPYNNYQLASNDVKYKDIFKAGHMNPDLVRHELHRVWKVEATLKPGERHIYGSRTFYIDEDSWQIALADHYDVRGNIWRVAEAYAVQYYYADTPFYAAEAIFDLIGGRYLVLGLQNESEKPITFGIAANKTDFTPAAIRRLGTK